MKVITGVVFACLLVVGAFSQEPAPSNSLPQPVAAQVNVSQPLIPQSVVPQQPAPQSQPPLQTTVSQPIPSSLSTPLYSMPSQPQVFLPLAQACGCGIKH